jgi:hypothetical protein
MSKELPPEWVDLGSHVCDICWWNNEPTVCVVLFSLCVVGTGK